MNEDGTEETGTSGQGEPKETVPGLLTPNPHDEEGTGEENEETVHAVKVKAYRMKKADEEGGPGWAELGMGRYSLFFCCFKLSHFYLIGVFRLKKDKSTSARRVLLRNSTNGKINIVRFPGCLSFF
jgi:nucleoporin NUP2